MPITLGDIITVRPRQSDYIRAAIHTHLKIGSITDTFLQRDSDFERYRSTMIGDIAKFGVKSWLERQGFAITDWDSVRTSWRSSRKLYDLLVNNCKIEIASSIEDFNNMGTNAALNRVLNEKHIIQPIRRTRKDIVLQVFFISDRNPAVHIMGWANWDDLEQYRTIRYVVGRPRDFWMVPFNESIVHTPSELVTVLRDWS
jgi:hypothetical protein